MCSYKPLSSSRRGYTLFFELHSVRYLVEPSFIKDQVGMPIKRGIVFNFHFS